MTEYNCLGFDFTEWVLASSVKSVLAESIGCKVTNRIWNDYKSQLGLYSQNIGGKWYVSTIEPVDESINDLPLTPPSVYHFEKFETSLAVINSPNSTITHNSVAPSAITRESDEFVQQVQSLGSFLRSAEQFLDARSEQIEQALRVKEQAVRDAKLQIHRLKTTADLAVKRSIEVEVESRHTDRQLRDVVDLGKSIHVGLRELES